MIKKNIPDYISILLQISQTNKEQICKRQSGKQKNKFTFFLPIWCTYFKHNSMRFKQRDSYSLYVQVNVFEYVTTNLCVIKSKFTNFYS